MRKYNKLKLRALSVFAERSGEWLWPADVARSLDFSPRRSVWTYLCRLSRFGLLDKRSTGRSTLQYRISERGLSRLKWLKAKRT